MIKVDSYNQQQQQLQQLQQQQSDNEQVNLRKSLAKDAASLGRLTRLREEIVEAVAAEDKPDHEDDWKIKLASQTALEKTGMYRCIQEAVTIGLLHDRQPPPLDLLEMDSSQHSSLMNVGMDKNNHKKNIDSKRSMYLQRYEQQMNPDAETLATRRTSSLPGRPRRKKTLGQRASDLLDAHVRTLYEEKIHQGWRRRTSTTNLSETWHGERHHDHERQRRQNLMYGRDRSFVARDESGLDDSIASLGSSTSASSLILSPLPTPMAPRWRQRVCDMSKETLKECVARQAAHQALDRTWRLEYQTHQTLMVRSGCHCVYCSDNPSAYQTQEYQRLQQSSKSDLARWSALVNAMNDEPLPLEGPPSSLVLLDLPSLEMIYGHPVERLETPQAIKNAMNQIIAEVAIAAWDRILRLKKKGQQHVVRDKCQCCYCRTASPAQTKQYQALANDAKGSQCVPTISQCDEAPVHDDFPIPSFSSSSLRKLHLDEDLDEEQLLLEGLGLTGTSVNL